MNVLYECDGNIFDIIKQNDGMLKVSVKVKDFSGEFTYCIEDENLQKYTALLEIFDLEESGQFKLEDMDSDSHIIFEKTKHGHMNIMGRLGSTFRNNYLVFEMSADQTVIRGLIERL